MRRGEAESCGCSGSTQVKLHHTAPKRTGVWRHIAPAVTAAIEEQSDDCFVRSPLRDGLGRDLAIAAKARIGAGAMHLRQQQKTLLHGCHCKRPRDGLARVNPEEAERRAHRELVVELGQKRRVIEGRVVLFQGIEIGVAVGVGKCINLVDDDAVAIVTLWCGVV